MRWIVDEASAASVDGARNKSEADRALMRDTLERANKVGAFKILQEVSRLFQRVSKSLTLDSCVH